MPQEHCQRRMVSSPSYAWTAVWANTVSSAVFQAGGLVVVLVEVMRKAYLASIVPVIVDAILNEHQLVVDIIAFVSHGDFPRSRLGEKQRGKILASWVTRKMRTIAQFGIRDADGADSQITEVPEARSTGSKNGSLVGGSTRHLSMPPNGENAFEVKKPLSESYNDYPTEKPAIEESYAPFPAGISEMPSTPFDDDDDDAVEKEFEAILDTPRGIVESPEDTEDNYHRSMASLTITNPTDPFSAHDDDDTPTTATTSNHYESSNYDDLSIQPTRSERDPTSPEGTTNPSPAVIQPNPFSSDIPASVPSFDIYPPQPPAPPPSMPLPAPPIPDRKGRDTLPSQQLRYSNIPFGASGLRVANPTSEPQKQEQEEEEEVWPQEAIMYGNLGNNVLPIRSHKRQESGTGSVGPGSVTGSVSRRYDGSGYGY